ncbi:hypothetical protein Emed_002067 [Eimeria media]
MSTFPPTNQQPTRPEMSTSGDANTEIVMSQTWISRPQAPHRLCITLLVLQLYVSSCTASSPQRFLQSHPHPLQQENANAYNIGNPHLQAAHAQSVTALAILSTIGKAYDVLGASLTGGPSTPPKKSTHETASGDLLLGVLVCVISTIILLGLIIFGIVKLVRKCKAKLSRRRAFGRARAAARGPTVRSTISLPPVVPTERRYPLFKDKLRSASLSTISSSHCEDKPPFHPKPTLSPQPSAKLSTMLPPLPSSASTSLDLASVTIQQFCLQQHSCQREETPTPTLPVPLKCATPQNRFLRLWRRH